jgi:hypothetical protein
MSTIFILRRFRKRVSNTLYAFDEVPPQGDRVIGKLSVLRDFAELAKCLGKVFMIHLLTLLKGATPR